MELREIRPIDIQKWQNNLLSKYKNSYKKHVWDFSDVIRSSSCLDYLKNPAKVIGNVREGKLQLIFGQRRIYKSYFNFLYDDLYQHFGFYLYVVL